MADQGEFTVRYWGVTGSFPNPLPPEVVEEKLVTSILLLAGEPEFRQRIGRRELDADWLRQQILRTIPFADRSTYGGNTTCLEIETPEVLVIVDAGSGFRRLGEQLARRWNRTDYRGDRRAHVVLTHAHIDHTQAVPFVEPFYDPRNHFTLWGTKRVRESLDALLSPTSPLRHVYFPPTYETLAGIKEFREIVAGDEFRLESLRVRSFPLHHPGDSLAFRFEGESSSIVFASDHEQTEVPDLALAEFARGADLLYLDAQYYRAEYLGEMSISDEAPIRRSGWGHSHVEGSVATAVAAEVARLHLGHQDPKRDDRQLATMEQHAQQLARELLSGAGRPADALLVQLAREGETISI